MKRYHDIVGDGGSGIIEQVMEQRARISDGLAGVRHLVAVGSGKGGVGKSTLTLQLAIALRAMGLRIAILDADFNGPSQARMAGVEGALFVPGSHKVSLPRTKSGIGVFSMGSLLPESMALEFESAAHGDAHTWRATREFALLGEILASFEWGTLDLLLFDLPPGTERTVQYADFLGPRTSFVLVTIPSEVSRGVVARTIAAFSNGPNRVSNRLLGYVENMSGYYCRDCRAIKPLFPSAAAPPSAASATGAQGPESPRNPGDTENPHQERTRGLGASQGAREARAPMNNLNPSPGERGRGEGLEILCLGTVPFDPELARQCDLGSEASALSDSPVRSALDGVARQLLDSLASNTEHPR